MKTNWEEALVPALALGFGAAYFAQTTDGPVGALKWPVIVAAITTVCFTALVVTLVRTPRPEGAQARGISKSAALRSGLMCLVPVLYLVLMPRLGFFLASLIFLACLSRLLGSRSWLRNLGVALIVVTLLYLLLVVFMKMPLPRLAIGSFSL